MTRAHGRKGEQAVAQGPVAVDGWVQVTVEDLDDGRFESFPERVGATANRVQVLPDKQCVHPRFQMLCSGLVVGSQPFEDLLPRFVALHLERMAEGDDVPLASGVAFGGSGVDLGHCVLRINGRAIFRGIPNSVKTLKEYHGIPSGLRLWPPRDRGAPPSRWPFGQTTASVRRQRVNDGAAAFAVGRIALVHQLGERLAHGLEVGELAVDDLQLAVRQLSRFGAGASLFEPQQACNLLERETEHLRALDEANVLGEFGRVAALPVERPFRLREQAAPLVVADRLHVDTSLGGQPPDREFRRHVAPLDSVPWYGL
mmetsp:Transcript_34218/g.62206  ORF Transcript_34218/g.62206 Transcript_34218/m.62206 type:complete len:314 (+) Transcript_34218:498-1439(+)